MNHEDQARSITRWWQDVRITGQISPLVLFQIFSGNEGPGESKFKDPPDGRSTDSLAQPGLNLTITIITPGWG